MPEASNLFSSGIFYRKTGKGQPVILLHGFPESSALWQGISGELSKNNLLIMPDFPGSGNSVAGRATSIGDMAECVHDIMLQEGLERAVIAGHSMGGYVGFEFASRYAEKVAGLSLIHSTPAADDEEKKIIRQKSIEIIRNGGKNAFINQMIPNLFSGHFKQTQPLAVKKHLEQALDMDDNSLINFYEAMKSRTDHTNMLEKAPFGLQWIAGINDNILNYKKILELCHVSNTNFVSLYGDCGHMSMLEWPGKLITDLKKFIDYSYSYHMPPV